MNLKVLDANGMGTDSGVIAALDKAVKLRSKYNIRDHQSVFGQASL